jgi:hypothetical protein
VIVGPVANSSHYGDDLFDPRRVSGILPALISRWTASVVAGHGSRATGGVQQHDSMDRSLRQAGRLDAPRYLNPLSLGLARELPTLWGMALSGVGELAANVPGDRRTMSDAEARWFERQQAARGARRLIGIDVEDTDDRLAVVSGKSIGGDQSSVLRDPHGELAGGMSRSADQLGSDLPIQGLPSPHVSVELNRLRRGNARHGLLEQRPLPGLQLRRRQLHAPSEHVCFLGWAEQVSARSQGQLVRKSVIVGMSVGEPQLADWRGTVRYPKPVGKCIEAGVAVRRHHDGTITIAAREIDPASLIIEPITDPNARLLGPRPADP